MNALLRAVTQNGFDTIEQALGLRDITSSEMRSAICGWTAEWGRRAPDDDLQSDPCQRIPYAVVSRLYRAVFGEYDSTLNMESPSAKLLYLDRARHAFDARQRELMQWAMVGGACLAKPIATTDGSLQWHVIRRDCYLTFGRAADGTLTDIATCEKTAAGKRWYTLVERRTAGTDGRLTIENRLYSSAKRETLGQRVPLTALEQYAKLPERSVTSGPVWGVGMVELRMPAANCVDGSADGISVYEPAMGLITNINHNEWELRREFELGRARVIASADLLKTDNGRKDLKDDLFVGLDEDPARVGLTTFAPALRHEAYEARRQTYLRATETLLGIKRGLLSDAQVAEKTATEITDSAGGYALTIKDYQIMWYDALRSALHLADQWGQCFGLCDAAAWDEKALAVTWGNGVLYDADKEWADRLEMVQQGLLRPELAVAWKFDLPAETEEDLVAIRQKYMPALTDLESGG